MNGPRTLEVDASGVLGVLRFSGLCSLAQAWFGGLGGMQPLLLSTHKASKRLVSLRVVRATGAGKAFAAKQALCKALRPGL